VHRRCLDGFSRANFSRLKIPAPNRHARRVDYEYERAGTASIFMFTEPLAGRLEATARGSKAKVAWAGEVARLLEGRYRQCSTVTLVCDNLNAPTIGAFYEAFPPARARARVRRLRLCHTPKHGSWLNMAENELSSLTRQRVSGRRFGILMRLQSEIGAWSTDAYTAQQGVGWQRKINDARGKLKPLYPKINL
jgi:hypothetical protein